MKSIFCDVLVVGGGGGGLRAAIAAREENPQLKVILATKGQLGKSGVTALACSDRMAFHATLKHTQPQKEDSWKYHAADIYEIGGRVSDGNLAEVLAKNAEDAFDYLDKLGVPFVKKNGIPDQFITDGSDYPRACYTGPKTAVHIEEALVNEIRKHDIEIIENCMAGKIIVNASQVTGAILIDTKSAVPLDQAVTICETGKIILAAGGAGKAYLYNVFPRGAAGDAYALAYDAGAELVNMEFIQIGIASVKTKLNCSGSAMRAVPRIINSNNEEFLDKYFPAGTSLEEIYNCVFQKGASWPVTYEHKTHIIDIAVYKEMLKGNKVYLDYSKNPKGFIFDNLSEAWKQRYQQEMTINLGEKSRQETPLNRLREINSATISWLKERGIDLEAGEKIEIAACIQHFQGGVKIDEKGQTKITGLYAVGECAGGQHGANRPGGNALLDSQVFGKIAGIDAARSCSLISKQPVNEREVKDFFEQLKIMEQNNNTNQNKLGNIGANYIRKKLQKIMHGAASIVRTDEGLKKALAEIYLLKNTPMAVDDNGYAFALETKYLICAAEMILKAAILRDESRGPHLRFNSYEDPEPIARKDPDWQKYIVISRGDGEMILETRVPQKLSFEIVGD